MGEVSLKCHTRMEPSCDRRLGVPATRSRLTLWLATLTAAAGLPWRRSVHLFDLLAEIEDPRRAEGKLCRLPQVVLFAILAIVAGANSYRTARQKLAQAMTFLAAAIVVGCSSLAGVSAACANVDGGPEHSHPGDPGATASRKCGCADQLSALRTQAPRRSGLAAVRGPAGPAGHAVADHHQAQHPHRLRAVPPTSDQRATFRGRPLGH